MKAPQAIARECPAALLQSRKPYRDGRGLKLPPPSWCPSGANQSRLLAWFFVVDVTENLGIDPFPPDKWRSSHPIDQFVDSS